MATSYKSVSGNSMWYPQEKGFKPTFWGNGWNANETANGSGKMEKGSSGGGKMKGSMFPKHGKCPGCS